MTFNDGLSFPIPFLMDFPYVCSNPTCKAFNFRYHRPTLVPTGTNLVTLRLGRIPSSGYISPEETATSTCLSTLTALGEVALEFR